MGQNKIKEIAVYQRKIAALEKELGKQNRKLLALPGKLGFKTVDDLINALRAAAGGKATVAARINKSGAPRRKRATITPEMKQKLKGLVEAGKTGGQIAKALGISLPSVHNIKKALGLVKGRK